MKRIVFLICLLGAVLVVPGCKSGLDGFLSGVGGKVVRPTSLFEGELAQLKEFFNSEGFLFCLSNRLLQEHTGYAYPGYDYALVINSQNQLHDEFFEYQGEKYEFHWPEIDFEHYSLVVGCFAAPSSAYYLSNQRIVKKGDKCQLYIEISIGEGAYFIHDKRFGALYPKLPDGPIEVIRRNNY